MAIVFGSDIGVQQNTLTQFVNELNNQFRSIIDGVSKSFSAESFKSFGAGVGNKVPPPPKENVHVDSGFSNVPGTSFVGSTIDNVDDIKQRRITTQEPSLTVYVKKRAFSSLRDENDTRFMGKDERLFLRATKLLFEKKCSQIAAYEAMTKASQLISEDAILDSARIDYLIEILDGVLSDTIEDLKDSLHSGTLSQLQILDNQATYDTAIDAATTLNSIVEGLKQISQTSQKLKQATHTNWVIDQDQPDVYNVGRGSGVIELTMISSINTSLSLEDKGRFDFMMEDPYGLTKITNDDIELAIGAADAEIKSKSWGSTGGPQHYLDIARAKENELRTIRRSKISSTFHLSTDPFSSTDKNEIVFEVNPSSASSNKVQATIGLIPEPFNKSNYRIMLAQLPAEQQLTIEEDILVQEIFDHLAAYVAEYMRINEAVSDRNKSDEVVYTRRNLRKHYLGKSIIQPMDVVHVYMRSNTIKHDELIGPLNYLLNNSAFVSKFKHDSNVSDAVLEEEMRQFGIDDLGIDVNFYRMIRTGSLLRNGGTHVFAGLVSSVSESYSADRGTYVLNVSGESNLKWLDMSRVSSKPSLDQTQGMLEDPLTPFNIKIDGGTGLTVEEPELLLENKEKIKNGELIYTDGSHRGKRATEKNLKQDYIPSEEELQVMWQHVNGLAYRWKEGIVTQTRRVNLTTSLSGSDNNTENLKRYAGLTITSSPFESLDAADIVSLLITGFPHNYESFYESSKNIGSFTTGGQDNTTKSYFHSFFDITRSTNRVFGNFIPFKTINISAHQLGERLKLEVDLARDSKTLRTLRSELAEAQDKLNAISTPSILENYKGKTEKEEKNIRELVTQNRAIRDETKSYWKQIVDDLQRQITKATTEFQKYSSNDAGQNSGLRLYGHDYAFADSDLSNSGPESETAKEKTKRIRLKNTIVQVRPQSMCKFNTDQNLFIVGDEYDKDLDIQAFVLKSISGQQQDMWQSDYKTPMEICRNVAETLDFEFYADTQGHIQFKPPRYNKVPLSLILKMFVLQDKEGVQLYPTFLESMFKSRVSAFDFKSQIIEKEIIISNILLGHNVNDKLVAEAETRITTPRDGDAIVSDFLINLQSKINDALAGNLARSLINTRNELRNLTGGSMILGTKDDIDSATKEIKALNDSTQPNANAKRLAETNKLTQLISEKQKTDTLRHKLSQQAEKHKNKRLQLNDINDLEPFSDLIEDDFNDFLGPGSSQRFIIHDDQIINYNFEESDKNVFCRIDVTGQVDLIGDGPGDLAQMPMLWAGATDFDLWRQYGYRPSGSVNKPFFKDAEVQCAPYAMMLLTRARKNAVRGTITVVGNEYYQLGDVVYINSRDMLFYVSSIKHSFAYEGGRFTTTLSLQYGHTLGEYIPTPLDVIGKNLIKNQTKFNARATFYRKTAKKSNGIPLGVVIFSDEQKLNNHKQDMLSGIYEYTNVEALKNALTAARIHIGNNEYPKIEVRGFITSETRRSKIEERMTAVVDWFLHPCGRYIKSKNEFITISDEKYVNLALSMDEIANYETDRHNAVNILVELSEDNINKGRLPSSEATNAATTGYIDNVIEIVLVYE